MPKFELFDRNEVMEKATNLFWLKGYKATSMNDLTREIGIGSGSFYNSFGNKRKLFDACLSLYREGGIQVISQVLNSETDPISGIRKFLNFQAENLLLDPYSKGCLIANTSAEMSHDKEISDFLLENNQILKSKIVDYLSDTYLSDQAEAIGDAILIYTTGVTIITKFMKDPARLKASNELFLKSIQN